MMPAKVLFILTLLICILHVDTGCPMILAGVIIIALPLN